MKPPSRTTGLTGFQLALAALLCIWLTLSLLLNLPGHLSTDSLIQIAEGRARIYESYNPPFISLVFGQLTAVAGGPWLLVLLSCLMMAFSLWRLLASITAPRRTVLVGVACLMASPVFLVYPSTVWKDVWFAHLTLLAFALIPRPTESGRLWKQGMALLLLAAAMSSRQTGVLAALPCVAAMTLADGGGGGQSTWLRRLPGAALRLLALVGLVALLSLLVRATAVQMPGASFGTGVRLVAIFDISGMLQRTPEARLLRMQSLGVDTSSLETAARRTFNAERVDTLDFGQNAGFWAVPLGAVMGQWADLVSAHPHAYLAHRAETFAWLLGLRQQARCLPVHVGFEREHPWLTHAGIDEAPSRHAHALYRYAQVFVGSPYFAPLAWALLSVTIWAAMLRRRQGRHPVALLQCAGLVYLASYAPIGMSCDFRYTYFSVLAAAVGLMYLMASRPPQAAEARVA